MRISANSKFTNLTVVGYGVVATLLFVLVIGALALAKQNDRIRFDAGSGDIVIPSSLA
jgi:hypothetical protein